MDMSDWRLLDFVFGLLYFLVFIVGMVFFVIVSFVVLGIELDMVIG